MVGLHQKFYAFNSKFRTLRFTAAEIDTLPKSNLESSSASNNVDAKIGGRVVTVNSGPTTPRSIANAVSATNVLWTSATPKKLVSKYQFGSTVCQEINLAAACLRINLVAVSC